MAKRRRHYRGLVRVPGLGALHLDQEVHAADVAAGVGIGVVGAAAARYVENKVLPITWKTYLLQPTGVWAWVHANMPAVGAVLAGALAYLLETRFLPEKHRDHERGFAHLLGAAGVGVGIFGLATLQSYVPSFRGLVRVPGLGQYGFLVPDQDAPSFKGLITRDGQFKGLITRDAQARQGVGAGMPNQDVEKTNLRGLARMTRARARAL